jgi:hypothetical protein
MFAEEKFIAWWHRRAACRLPNDAEAAARLQAIGQQAFLRVGKTLKVALAAVELTGGRRGPRQAGGEEPGAAGAGGQAGGPGGAEAGRQRPLLYKADAGSVEAWPWLPPSARWLSGRPAWRSWPIWSPAKAKGAGMVLAFGSKGCHCSHHGRRAGLERLPGLRLSGPRR